MDSQSRNNEEKVNMASMKREEKVNVLGIKKKKKKETMMMMVMKELSKRTRKVHRR